MALFSVEPSFILNSWDEIPVGNEQNMFQTKYKSKGFELKTKERELYQNVDAFDWIIVS